MNKEEIVLLALNTGRGFTPVQIQKMIFLMQKKLSNEISEDVFNFEAYHYGPFNSSIYDTLNDLETRGLVKKTLFANSPREYKITEDGEHTSNEISFEKREYIKSLSDYIHSLSFSELVSKIYKDYPDMKKNSVFEG
jgi:uncharacterized protein